MIKCKEIIRVVLDNGNDFVSLSIQNPNSTASTNCFPRPLQCIAAGIEQSALSWRADRRLGRTSIGRTATTISPSGSAWNGVLASAVSRAASSTDRSAAHDARRVSYLASGWLAVSVISFAPRTVSRRWPAC